jgi:hypothetical protein
MAKRLNVGDLNRLYRDAETVDKTIFSEQRSNILLIAGEHYSKRAHNYFSQIRDNRDMTDYQKLRLAKNHTHKIHRRYVTSILKYASGVSIVPHNDTEMQDQKAAELNSSVWEDAKYRYRLKEKARHYASDYVGIGEVAVKLTWNPDGGAFKGFEQQVDEFGEPVFDEEGEPVADKDLPVFEGDFEFERLFGFNLLRAPEAKTMDESPYLIYRKMVSTKVLRERYKHDPDKLKAITEGNGEEYVVFEATRGGYEKAKGQTPVREYFFRPCAKYPQGRYFISTQGAILEEGELPFGVFPIVYAGFDEHPTSPRGRGLVKQVRPYQAEINRASSAMALHQITIGDDKVIYQSGTKLAPGALLPGVRGITYQGSPPQILQGRDGGQYQNYINSQIQELYSVVDLVDMLQPDGEKASPDMYAMLFRSAKQRQNISVYSEKFEQFMVDLCTLFLTLARQYYPDDKVIPAVGRKELVNMAEFRQTSPLHYQIKVVPEDDTLDTQFGKQLTFQHLLQYAGGQLSREDIGRVMRNMPFANSEDTFEDFTIDADDAKNMILALERGEYPDSIPEDNHDYLIKRLTNRIKQADFKYLAPEIQQAYYQKRQEHQQFLAEQEQKILAAKNEYIPADGPMIACDMYVEQDDPNKAPKRARIPQRALDWLVKQLKSQNGSLERLEQMNGGAAEELAGMLTPGGGQAGPQAQMMPGQLQ